MWTIEQKLLRLCCVNAIECSQAGADIATSLNHTKKMPNNSRCRLKFLQRKWKEQQDDDRADLALSYDRIPTSTGHRAVWHLQVFALGKILCEKRFVYLGIAHISLEPSTPTVIYVHYTAHQAFWTPEIHKYDHKQVCHHLSSQAFSPPSIPPNRQCPNRKGVFFIMGFP